MVRKGDNTNIENSTDHFLRTLHRTHWLPLQGHPCHELPANFQLLCGNWASLSNWYFVSDVAIISILGKRSWIQRTRSRVITCRFVSDQCWVSAAMNDSIESHCYIERWLAGISRHCGHWSVTALVTRQSLATTHCCPSTAKFVWISYPRIYAVYTFTFVMHRL